MTEHTEREAVARLLFEGEDPDKCIRWHNERGGWTCVKRDWETELGRADRIIAEHIVPLRATLATAERERDEARSEVASWEQRDRAQMQMILSTIGGAVEGYPTSCINYLQRLRQLTIAEKQLVSVVNSRDDLREELGTNNVELRARASSAEALLTEAAATLTELIPCVRDPWTNEPFQAGDGIPALDRAIALLTRIQART